jgi:hypothetical protein
LSVEIPHWLFAASREPEGDSPAKLIVYRSLQLRKTSPRFAEVQRFIDAHEVSLVERVIVEDDDMFLCRAEVSTYVLASPVADTSYADVAA